MKLGFLGAGNMGTAMMRGIAASALCKNGEISEIFAFDTDSAKLGALSDAGIKPCDSAQALSDTVDFLVLAVKPQVLGGVLDALKLRKEQVIVSICAGISAEFIRSHTIPDARIILCMPNTPLMLGLGATALAKCDGVTDAEFSLAMQMFATCGIAEEIPESKMREIIAVNSSSPAFLYLYAKGFLEFAKAEGLDDGAALRLFAQAMIGSAKMMTDSGYSIDELIKMVSSPGGTTLAGLDQLYAGDLTDTVRKCCDACTTRAYELAGAERKAEKG
ncbi:MAG TPA: pyrroline-5-carboxylate reductase [Ruminococcus sp.]|nr:pyrroline-5-carboxylate reductase [Ruminococcus sp.]